MQESDTWIPSPRVQEESRLQHFLRDLRLSSLEGLARFAQKSPEDFWAAVADDIGIEWSHRFHTTRDISLGLPWTQWWMGGQLNLVHNAVFRHSQSHGSDCAIVAESDGKPVRSLIYSELADLVRQAAFALHELGIRPGDAVGICMPMIPETVAFFLACSYLGAIVAPLFSGYGAGAISSRLNDCEAKVLCITDGFSRRGHAVSLINTADEVARMVPSINHIIIVPHLNTSAIPLTPTRDYIFTEKNVPDHTLPSIHAYDANDPFMLIYTSGTTGRPKGTVHTQGGFPIKATQDMAHCFDVRKSDRLLWFTDLGWMMGPWAILGTLTLGATLVLFDGVPDYPEPDRLWDVVEKHQVSVLGIAPTVVRSLMTHGHAPVRKHNLSSLRILGSSGEPWNVEPWLWYYTEIGKQRCPIINYSGGTEVSGGIISGNLLTPIKPCSFSGTCPGMIADVVGENGHPVRQRVGELVVKQPWPGMTKGFWNDPQRYIDTYWSRFPNTWVHGDWAEITSDGLWYIRGRSDDTIKVAGKRIGPAEVESALVAHPSVAEAVAVGVPDPLKGEILIAFIVLTPGTENTEDLRAAITNTIISNMGKALKPAAIIILPELPKTRNAKVLRRVVRAVYIGKDPGDLSSLENPSSLIALENARGNG